MQPHAREAVPREWRFESEGVRPAPDGLHRDAGERGVGQDAAAGVVDPEDEFPFDRLSALLQLADQPLHIGDLEAEDLGDLFGALAPVVHEPQRRGVYRSAGREAFRRHTDAVHGDLDRDRAENRHRRPVP